MCLWQTHKHDRHAFEAHVPEAWVQSLGLLQGSSTKCSAAVCMADSVPHSSILGL